MTRPFSSAKSIPIIDHTQRSDVPDESVLSRLSIFGRRRDVPDTHTELNRELDWDSQERQQQRKGAQEIAQRQEKEEAQKQARRQEQEKTRKDPESDPMSGPFPHHVAGGRDGSRGWTIRDSSEHEGGDSEDADTGTGSEASVPDYSSDDGGWGDDGWRDWGGGGRWM